MTDFQYVGKHQKIDTNDYKTPIHGACFHGESWYKCPFCNKAFEAYDVDFEHDFKRIKADKHYGYYQHKCGGIVACEWMRDR